MLWQPYLWNPPLDRAEFWICCSSYTPLLTDRRDLKAHNAFDRNHHRTFLGKQKEIHLQGSFGRRPIYLYYTVGSCPFVDIQCAQMLSSLWTVEIRKTRSSKVLFMLNSSSLIFKLARFYLDLERSNCWIILILRYIVQDSKLYILTVGFGNKI